MANDAYRFEYDEREICPLDSLPEILKPIKNFKALCDEYGVELESLYTRVKKVLDDQFINTASEEIIARWESYLEIIPKTTDTLDERRFRIMVLLTDDPPYTDLYLSKWLDALVGHNYRIVRDYNNYTLSVELSADSLTNTTTIQEKLTQIIPANMKVNVSQYRTRHYELGKYTHAELAAYTQDELKYASMFEGQE